MKGRSDNLKNEVAKNLRQIISSYIRVVDAASNLNLQLSVEISELQNYEK
jgi:5-carboxymethyl-2-hydroxymuconate isomerase